ncbi:unnamed protein product, partial [Ixodes hexagonus]
FHSTPVYISDHRPVCITLKLEDNRPAASSAWRFDNRILLDPDTRETLSVRLKKSLRTTEPATVLWDALKSDWRGLCEGAAKAWRRQQNTRLWETVLRIRIVLRGSPLTPLMQEYLSELQRRYERLLRMSSAASTATWNRSGPQSHPEVLRMANQTLVRERQPPVVGDAAALGVDDPTVRDQFVAHFASLARSEGVTSPPPGTRSGVVRSS